MRKTIIVIMRTLFAGLFILAVSISGGFAQQQSGNVSIEDTTNMSQQTLKHDYDTKFETEVNKEDMPEEVTTAIEEAYANHEIKKIFQARNGTYKVELENDNGKLAAFYGINGKLLRTESIENDGPQ